MHEADSMSSQTDVLIVGAGPSGLMSAYWMARYGIRARVIDKKAAKPFTGYADGLRMRTLELFDSMGIQHRVNNEAQSAVEVNFWVPGDKGQLIRQGPITPAQVHKSPFHHMLLSQARLEGFILDSIHEHSDIQVERGMVTESLQIDETLIDDPDAYPITVQLKKIDQGLETNGELPPFNSAETTKANGFDQNSLSLDYHNSLIEKGQKRSTEIETVKAKYIIGCDGAHSWTRGQLDIPFEGESTEHVWGVIDVVPITNFPDIRRLCTVTTSHGTILVVPRERKLVRLYVPVQVVNTAEDRFDRSKITPEDIKTRVQIILAPYTFDYQILDWWTAYQIGQRMAPRFSRWNRVFIGGDAVHTHSPKVGLGMNVSMQDGFNIGWKVALVVSGAADPCILKTYHTERHHLAELLVEFDKSWSNIFTQDSKSDTGGAPGRTENMMQIAEKFEDFADGIKTFYGESPLVWKQAKQEGHLTAFNLVPGERVPPTKLRMHAEGNTLWTTRLLESDGQFKLVILAGDIREALQKQRLDSLCEFLSCAKTNCSPLIRYNSAHRRLKSLVDVITIHSTPWTEAEFFDFPLALRPLDAVTGWKYEKIWCDDLCSWDRDCDGMAYEKWGVDRSRGAVFVVRPDQYIGWVGEFENIKEVVGYFDGFLLQKTELE